jgi:2-keto-4-pentenoate hydratase
MNPAMSWERELLQDTKKCGCLLAALLANTRGGQCDGQLDWLALAAGRLFGAERDRCPVPLLSGSHPGLDLRDAYCVQWHGTALRIRRGAQVLGHKVGLTSQAMQRQVGIDEADSGILLDRMLLASGGTLVADELIVPRVEAEVAFRMGTDLAGDDITEEAARAAVAEVFLALEVIDSRFGTAPMTLADSVADNAGGGRFVLGEPVTMPLNRLRDEQVTVSVDNSQVAVGYGRDVLGDPIRSVLWLARRLGGFGAGLRAGDLVLAGAVHAAFPLEVGTTVLARSPHLGPVSLHVL